MKSPLGSPFVLSMEDYLNSTIIDRSKILVYTEDDIINAVIELEEVHRALHYFTFYFEPYHPNLLGIGDYDPVVEKLRHDLDTPDGVLRRIHEIPSFNRAASERGIHAPVEP